MSEIRFKNALSELDSNQRICLLYLERMIKEHYKKALKAIPSIKQVDLSILDTKFDNLQKQIDKIKSKNEDIYNYIQELDDFRKTLIVLFNDNLEMIQQLKNYRRLVDGKITEKEFATLVTPINPKKYDILDKKIEKFIKDEDITHRKAVLKRDHKSNQNTISERDEKLNEV